MTMGWHMMMQFSPALYIREANHNYKKHTTHILSEIAQHAERQRRFTGDHGRTRSSVAPFLLAMN
jgi:hypothetical protein